MQIIVSNFGIAQFCDWHIRCLQVCAMVFRSFLTIFAFETKSSSDKVILYNEQMSDNRMN